MGKVQAGLPEGVRLSNRAIINAVKKREWLRRTVDEVVSGYSSQAFYETLTKALRTARSRP